MLRKVKRFLVRAVLGLLAPIFSLLTRSTLAPFVGADLGLMKADTLRMRGKRPFVFSNLKGGEGVEPIADFIIENGGLAKTAAEASDDRKDKH